MTHMQKCLRPSVLIALALVLMGAGTHVSAADPAPRVVVTNKPIHSLAAQIMAGAGVPELLIAGAGSPHTYALKPSDAQRLAQADVFVRVSAALEPFSERALGLLPPGARTLTLDGHPGIAVLPTRTSPTFEAEHVHDHGHGHKAKKAEAQHAEMDGHIWLDPKNAREIGRAITSVLSARDPTRASVYNANFSSLDERLKALDAEIAERVAPIKSRPFVVLHDAYQYFERRYGVTAAGSVQISPDQPPGAKRLRTIRQKITSLSATCVFSEPGVDAKILGAVTEGTRAKTAVLDPEGLDLAPGPELYATMMRNLAGQLATCLTPPPA